MKKIIVIALMCAVSARAQVYKPILFPEKVDEKYIVNPLKEHEKYFKKVRKSLPKKDAENFCAMQAYTKSGMFSNGEIYLSWPAMETYVNQVLDSILPSSLANKKIKAFIGRSSAINAYCLYDGTMIVNVGLLAEVKNEAALAAIMGHELAHYMKNHHLNRLKKAKKNRKNKLGDKLNYMGFSQDNEMEADKIGFGIARDAGYDVNEAGSNFELLIREEQYYRKRNGSTLAGTDSVEVTTEAGKFKANTLEKLLSTHPDMKERQQKLNEFVKAGPQDKPKKFKVGEEQFSKLQSQARLESISLILNNNDYQECTERAFIYYLFHPTELTYAYYVAESTRRLCLLNYRLRNKGFLTHQLTNNGFRESEGILHDLKYLLPNEERFNMVKAKDLTGKEIPFETYKEAFAYFTKKLLERNYQEAYLMRALFENNKAKIKENVTKYLASAKAEHKEYAKHYQANTLTESISKHPGEIVMIPRVNFYRHDVFNNKYAGDATHFYFSRSEITGKEMANDFAQAFNGGLQDVKGVSLPFAATQNFNTKYKYETVLAASLLARRDENEGYEVVHYYKELEDEDYIGKTDIFRLSPDIWEFFNANQINAITYASYTRHKNMAARRLRIVYLFFGPMGWAIAAAIPVHYKKLSMFSYDSRLGTLYYDAEVKPYRLRATKAKKMFLNLRKTKAEFIKDYNSAF